ncbi:MAG: prepilin-type N-terminal cleavage/methylation domain-containing protein [Blastocatellales bacterium]
MKNRLGKAEDRRQKTEDRRQKNISLPSVYRRLPSESGFTLLELIITLAIIAILAAGTIPVARNLIKRDKEMELRRNLRELRKAIDAYKIACEAGMVGPLDRKVDDECYPPSLEILVEGIHPPNKGDSTVRFLRRIPKDPFTDNTDWGLRSVQDDSGSTSWGGENVYDIFSKASGTALDGKTQYKDW